MADNYVEIRIKADDTAKPDLTALRADLDELGTKVDTAKVDVDDEDAKAKLLDMNAKLAALNKKVANPRISVAGAARAEADIAKVNADMDKLEAKAKEQEGTKGGLLGKILFGAASDAEGGGGGGGSGGLLGSFGSLPSLGEGLGGILSNPYGIAAVVTTLQAALVEVTGLVSGFAAAGAGVGAFGLLAYPTITQITGALGDTKAQLDKLPEPIQASVGEIKNVKAQFADMAKSFQIPTVQLFSQALGIASDHMQILGKLAEPVLGRLTGLLANLNNGLNSKGFSDWLKKFTALEGPSITAIGDGIGKVVVAFGKLLTIMSTKDVVNAINIAFSILSGTISALGAIVKFTMKEWDGLTTTFDQARRVAKTAGHDIASVFDTVRHAAASLAHGVASSFDQLRADIHRQISGTINDLRSNWKLIVALIGGPIGLAVDAAVTHIRGLETAFRVGWDVIKAVVKAAVGVITAILRPFAALLEPLFRGAWNAVVAVFRWAFGLLHSTASSGVNALNQAVSSGIDRMIGFVRAIPGRINSALGGLPSMLFRAGANAISGLINGMGSMVGSAISMAAGWGHDIVNALGSAFGIHFSEPSEATKMIAAGRQIPRGLATGMLSGTGALRSAATTVSGAAYPHLGGAAGGGGGPITLNITGSDSSVVKALVLALRREIRVQGGNVQTVLGH